MKTLTIVVIALAFCVVGAHAQITSAASGNWDNTATWTGGVLPGATDNVVIADGHTVTINADASVASLTVGGGASGTLTFDNVAVRTIAVAGNLTISAGGSFLAHNIMTTGDLSATTTVSNVASTSGLAVGMEINGEGITTGTTITAFDATTITLSIAATATATGVELSIGYNNLMSVGGDVTNNGSFDMSLGGTAGVCNVTFTKAGDQAINGTGTLTRFREVTLDKGGDGHKVVCSIDVSMAGGNITFTSGTWEQTAGRLTATSGTMSVGTAATTSAFNIIGSGSARIANNINVWGQLLVNTSDSVIVGTMGHKIDLTNVNGAVATFTKGTVLIHGKLAMSARTTVTIDGANIIIDPKGFAEEVPPGTDYAFRRTTGGGTSSFTFTSGTVSIINSNSTTGANPELAMSASIAPDISGTSTFVLGQGAGTLPSAEGYKINLNSVGILNNLTINTGSVDVTLLTNVTANGTLTITSSGTLGGSFTWRSPHYLFNGAVAQVTGSIMPDSVGKVTIDNLAGVTSSQALKIDTLVLVSGTLSGPYTATTTIGGSTSAGNEASGIPQNYSIDQNFPNPFNPSTMVRFSLPEASFVIVRVFDMLGREVAELVNEVKQAGVHTVSWHADRVGAGVYLCRIQSGTYTSSIKMTVLK